MITYADKWYDENEDRLLAEGAAKGRVEGRAEAVLMQLRLRFGELSQEVEARVKQASAEEVEVWTERVLSAGSLDEVLR